MLKNSLFLIFLVFSINSVHGMYATPNEFAVCRGGNYSFQAVASLDFAKYTVTVDSPFIPHSSKRNASHITTDFVIPPVINLQIYTFYVVTYDVNNYEVENCTMQFVIGNLTDEELFNIFEVGEEYKEKYEDVLEENKAILNNTTNMTNPWLEYKYESIWTENMDQFITVVLSISITSSILGSALLLLRSKYNEKHKETKRSKKEVKKNLAKAMLSKQSVSHSMDIFIPQNIDGKMLQVPLLSEFEREAVRKYHKYYDATFFLRPDDGMLKVTGKSKKELSSLDVLKYRFKSPLKEKEVPDYTTQWNVVSACVKYLTERGYVERNDNLFPMRCKLEDIKKYLGKLYDKKEEQALQMISALEEKKDETESTFSEATQRAKPKSRSKKDQTSTQIDAEDRIKSMYG